MDDDDDAGAEPHCEVCGTVMHVIDGGYRCRGCSYFLPLEESAALPDLNGLPGIRGW